MPAILLLKTATSLFPPNGLVGEVYFRNLAAAHDGHETDGQVTRFWVIIYLVVTSNRLR